MKIYDYMYNKLTTNLNIKISFSRPTLCSCEFVIRTQ